MNPAALEFRDVDKFYPQASGPARYALRGISFALPAGRIIAIVGRSGSGKSTLLHLAAGIDLPSQGQIRFGGRDLGALSERDRTLLRRDGIGLVFQFFYLLPHLSVQDNIALPEWIAGRSLPQFEPRLRELLAKVGLADRRNETVQKLSGGEMQRVAICRALLRRPRLLLADEPTGSLDDENGRVVMELLLQLAREEASTLIFVTHSRELARLADDVWHLHSGELEIS